MNFWFVRVGVFGVVVGILVVVLIVWLSLC